MDELSAFRFADPRLPSQEKALMARADLIFTGGQSLYEAKKQFHRAVHAFPSGVDSAHFKPARMGLAEPSDQQDIPRPRFGFFGVLDERLDQALLRHVALACPNWQFVFVGPVVKIEREELPQRQNIHYLGAKPYCELPSYAGGWDVALMPFGLNDATRFISPTKTPEYLAAGLPVVSTGIADVVQSYGKLKGVEIADSGETFVAACDRALKLSKFKDAWLPAVDTQLGYLSWEKIWERMSALIDFALNKPRVRKRREVVDILVVGAGFAGAVLAEQLARKSDKKVLVVDRRHHVGGNAYDVKRHGRRSYPSLRTAYLSYQ